MKNNIIQWQQNQVCLRDFVSLMMLAPWNLARKGWFEMHGKHRTLCLKFPSKSGLVSCNQEPHSEVISLFWKKRFCCSVFPLAESSIIWEGIIEEMKTMFPDLLKERKT